jgi:hypothetical protein
MHIQPQGCGFDRFVLLGCPAATSAFVLDHPGCMLRSVVSAMAANMMLVQMQFRCAHLVGVLDLDRQQS